MINKNSSHPEPRPLPLGRAPEGFYPGSNQMVSGSRRSIKAFTLIELLVVVLIIGILAAVAMPMYKRAVLKSQFSTLMPLAKNLWEGNEIFYLNNGEYAASVDELDVSAPADPKVQAEIGDEETHQYVRVSKTDIPNRITMYQKNSPNFAGETHCEALQDNAPANWLCEKGLQGTFVGNKFGYAVYALSDNSQGTLARIYHNVSAPQFTDGDECIASGPAQHQCKNGSFSNEAKCDGQSGWSCGGNAFTDHGVCIADAYGACYWATFNNSVCYGAADHGCVGVPLSNGSVCFGTVENSCALYYRGLSLDNSYCVGDANATCADSSFTKNSVCYANQQGSCTGNTYDDTSCCSGAYCPTEADTCAYKNITPPAQPVYQP